MDIWIRQRHNIGSNIDVDVDGDVTADSISAVHKAGMGRRQLLTEHTIVFGNGYNGTITIRVEL